MDRTEINSIKTFFNQWNTYDRVVYFNYMAHKEILSSLRQFLEQNVTEPFDLLDLGCGDCSQTVKIIEGTNIRNYTGVDISPVALEQAANQFQQISCNNNFQEADFSSYIESEVENSFDIVIAGYTVHHLFYPHKQAFFDNCYRILRKNGYLVHYDVMHLENETRDQYIDRYFSIIDGWENLQNDERESVKAHISECDYPSSYEEIGFMAMSANFKLKPGKLYTDQHSIHTLSCFQK